MKTVNAFLIVLMTGLFSACYIETAVPGRDGLDGQDGESIIGSVFEVEGDFKPSNDFSLMYEFPATFKVYDSDVVLVYILWDQVTDKYGKVQDLWRLLPQTVVLNEGVLQYNYDYTIRDVNIFLGGTIDLYKLLPAEALDQVFRIVVMPADFAMNHPIDVSDFGLVMKALGDRPESIQRVKLPETIK